ncbi:MAG: hypothetical protein ABI789_03355 [Usitatibacter sp.]
MEDMKQVVTAEQLKEIGGGGDCTAQQYVTLITQLTQSYEDLIDFSSHVIERVITSVQS